MFQHNRKIRFTGCAALVLAALIPGLVRAQGGTPYVGQLLYVGFNFVPVNYHACDGATMAISENETLYNLIGITYGGDGVNTFNLPDMRGRIPIHQGTNTLGSLYVMGQAGGSETRTLSNLQMPSHSHAVSFSAPISGASGVATSAVPTSHSLGNTGRNLNYSTSAPNVSLGGTVAISGTTSAAAGGGQPIATLQPYLPVNCLIALFGVYPTTN